MPEQQGARRTSAAAGRGELTEIRNRVSARAGTWVTVSDQIDVRNIQKRDIYRAPLEPSFVSWAILWKEADGTLKLSFSEALADPEKWPPSYDFASGGVTCTLKTLVSPDGGETWSDTGWRGEASFAGNSDHHIRHVFQRADGVLLRNNPHTLEGISAPGQKIVYDESKSMQDFPFTYRDATVHPKYSATQISTDGGHSWEEIHVNREEPRFWASGIHPLGNGSIVATGMVRDSELSGGLRQLGISESWDGGATWSAVQSLAQDDDVLAPQGLCEENDFVELADGRLLLIQRGGGITMWQMYLSRDGSGRWQATERSTHPQFVHSGYPFMYKAGDGTIFYYDDTAIRYTCDDGISWQSLPLGFAYYGQLVETRPGRLVAVSQKNIGDCPYPWKHDTAMLQTSFDYERIGVVEQTDPAAVAALGVLERAAPGDFHLYAEIRADGETGLVFDVQEDSYAFAAVVIPCNEFRAPDRAAKAEQSAALVLGRGAAGKLTVERQVGIGRIVPGAWVEMQVDRCGDLVKAAVKAREGDWGNGQIPAAYLAVRAAVGSPGKLGFFTNRSTGAFKNVRLGAASVEIRSNWRDPGEGARRIALDAGRQE